VPAAIPLAVPGNSSGGSSTNGSSSSPTVSAVSSTGGGSEVNTQPAGVQAVSAVGSNGEESGSGIAGSGVRRKILPAGKGPVAQLKLGTLSTSQDKAPVSARGIKKKRKTSVAEKKEKRQSAPVSQDAIAQLRTAIEVEDKKNTVSGNGEGVAEPPARRERALTIGTGDDRGGVPRPGKKKDAPVFGQTGRSKSISMDFMNARMEIEQYDSEDEDDEDKKKCILM